MIKFGHVTSHQITVTRTTHIITFRIGSDAEHLMDMLSKVPKNAKIIEICDDVEDDNNYRIASIEFEAEKKEEGAE